MNDTTGSRFVYVIYIKTTPEKLWAALTNPDITATYWFGVRSESAWSAGAPWKLVFANGVIGDSGEILECDPPKRLVLRWRNEFKADLHAEGFSTCTLDLTPLDGAIQLSLTHEMDHPHSPFIAAVAGGWPRILSNLKSLLETGEIALWPEVFRPT